MATINRKALAAYRRALDRVCADAGSAARKVLSAWLGANPGASVAEIREAAIDLVGAILGIYGDAASALACDLFDSIMEAEGVTLPAARVYGGVREGAVEGTVRRVVGGIDGSQGSLDAFTSLVGQLAERETRLAASTTVEENVERAAKTKAGRNVRYARVPTSTVPCEWCALLASRGFVYRSAESAEAASHHHCTCTIVPGVKGRTQVAGYDPKHYADVWKHRERYEGAASIESASEDPRWKSDASRQKERDFGIAINCVRPVFISPRGNERLVENIKRIKPREGWYDIHAHGKPGSVQVFSTHDVTPGELAYIIRHREDYHGEPIRLFSCHSAEGDAEGRCFGRELAAIMGVDVDAAPGSTLIFSDGSFILGTTGDDVFVSFHGGGGGV